MRLVEWKLRESEITEIADRRQLGGCALNSCNALNWSTELVP